MMLRVAGLLAALILLAPPPAGADLRRFFHGDPAPVAKSPPPKQLAVVSTAPDGKADPQVESFLRALAAALMARDGAALLPRLSARYAVEGAPEDMRASDFLLQAVAKIPGPERIVVRAVEANGPVRTARTDFHYEGGRVTPRTFHFDASGNLLASDLFRLQRG